ncbi:MAG: hypothetical protein H7Y88_01485 [Phycisphaerales bacterium]|nr:hypothetical protein [Phycisphaerales bacterium]
MRKMKAETILAELNRQRKDLGEDTTDIEWLAVHHAFVFLSFKMSDLQRYLDEQSEKGEFDDYEG